MGDAGNFHRKDHLMLHLLGGAAIQVSKRAGCFALFVFLVSGDCCVALPRDAMDLFAVYDYGIS